MRSKKISVHALSMSLRAMSPISGYIGRIKVTQLALKNRLWRQVVLWVRVHWDSLACVVLDCQKLS